MHRNETNHSRRFVAEQHRCEHTHMYISPVLYAAQSYAGNEHNFPNSNIASVRNSVWLESKLPEPVTDHLSVTIIMVDWIRSKFSFRIQI